MIHAYHVIWGTYGFWLPNDPRGSWSDFVHAWELFRFGKVIRSIDRSELDRLEYSDWRTETRQRLKFPAVIFTGIQGRGVGEGFKDFVSKSRLAVWACSILPEHIHLVLGRHRYKIESAVNLLKGAATRRLKALEIHPMEPFRNSNGGVPTMWAENQWKVYLDSEQAIENAIRYVENNPEREGKPRQKWSFVSAFEGIPKSGWTTYH